jgi:putative PIN family toxin of toxin-antitoxin system
MRVVLDTNTIISRYLSSSGPPAHIFQYWELGAFTLVISEPILAEIERVFSYPRINKRLRLGDKEIAGIVAGFATFGELVTPTQRLHVVEADPDDDMFIECAVEGKADYLVSGNTKHLTNLKEYQGIQILTPAQFVLVLEREARRKAA